VKVPRPVRRAPAESTPNRAAGGWGSWQADPAAAGQLQCLVRQPTLPGARSHAEGGAENADELVYYQNKGDRPENPRPGGRNPGPDDQPSAEEEVHLVEHIEGRSEPTRAGGSRQYPELAFNKAVEQLAEHADDAEEKAEDHEQRNRKRPKSWSLEGWEVALEGVSGSRTKPHGDDASVGLVGAEERSPPETRSSVDRGCEPIQPAHPDADSVVDKADEKR